MITILISSKLVGKVTEILENLLPKTQKTWKEKYPCGDGGWINYRVLNKEELNDVITLIEIKKKPVKCI